VPGARLPVVRRAAVLLAVEALALIALGVVDGIATAVGTPEDRGAALGIAAVAVGVGLVVLLLARAIDRLRGWARTPSVVLQLIAFPVGTDLVLGRVWLPGIVVLLLAGATLYHLAVAGPAFTGD